ncbi:hypothetical protein QN277_005619 [Acacia crassicarpa]|uniref:CCHC-type domain-containing protein n=1 Tax=Acacia crassicarpa TaxID=499986 RepID=A0AAE1MGK7_9FABA|nr:hypothetical protein QN277_005619 [Acacia crassicarpa]
MEETDEGVEQEEEAVDVWGRTGKLPKLQVSVEEYDAWCKPYRNSLIVKLLGKSVNVGFMRFRMERMWASKGPLRITPLNNGYFLVSFSSMQDREYALQEGPWMIADHYLLVQRWRPNFNPWKADQQKRVAMWVRIPDLPHELYNVESIRRIGNMIGKTLKIDRTTAFSEKGGFARMCVEVDLQRPLLPGFSHFGEERRFEFEGLLLVCFCCGRYGHRMDQCAAKSTSEEPVSQTTKDPVVARAVPEKSLRKEEDTTGNSKGSSPRVDFSPKMLVKRDYGKKTLKADSKAPDSAMAMTKAGKVHEGVNAPQDLEVLVKQGVVLEREKALEEEITRNFGVDVQNINKGEKQEWIQVGSKRKAGSKVKARGKENKMGIQSQSRGKGKGISVQKGIIVLEPTTIIGPTMMDANKEKRECSGPTNLWMIETDLINEENCGNLINPVDQAGTVVDLGT